MATQVCGAFSSPYSPEPYLYTAGPEEGSTGTPGGEGEQTTRRLNHSEQDEEGDDSDWDV